MDEPNPDLGFNLFVFALRLTGRLQQKYVDS